MDSPPKEDRSIMRNWIYSYLKYAPLTTPEQRKRSMERYKKYLEERERAEKDEPSPKPTE